MSEFTVETTQKLEVINITQDVQERVPPESDGLCVVYAPHTTMSLLIAETEDDLLDDYVRVMETWLVGSRPFKHCGHGNPNAEAHIFGALHGCSVVVPVEKGKLMLGGFQSILLCEADGPRQRKVRVYLYAA
jgi:secondary thiamine-phosphate synthase enzyme